MANPQLTAGDPALASLLAQLEANAAPAVPGAWPLAPVYWLSVIALAAGIVLAALLWRKGRMRRRCLVALKTLQREPDTARQLQQLHAVLRNAAAQQSPAHKTESAPVFAQRVRATLNRADVPVWVNAHYRPDARVEIDWREARTLIKRWCR
ncbi:DUF4381 domain-containing protein [Saccharospirillum impatiens]|jgi:hypothetical protein|uniref:DUF4381 domain-containing protein n=1 Tax=Saccharospirillum impatiens TaxID=169438 RepID=UPI00040686CE|nr:DUF4381 domain-containing protein [Saccharospirillum impatiens]